MAISARTLELLVKAGLEGEALIEVVRSMEADLASGRTGNAERQARYRERQRGRNDESNVTRYVTRNVTPPPLVPPLEVSPTPPSKTPPIIPPPTGFSSGAGALEAELRRAAGWEAEPAPNLAVTGPIEALIAAGAVLQTDVLPVVKAHAPRVRRPNSWRYFVPIIQDAMQARRQASTGPPRPQGSSEPQETFEQLRQRLVPGWTPGTKIANTG